MTPPELGDLPTPVAVEPQEHPGGVDAIVDDSPDVPPISRDLPPDLNPAVDDSQLSPEAEQDLEHVDGDKGDEPTSDGASKPQQDSPA